MQQQGGEKPASQHADATASQRKGHARTHARTQTPRERQYNSGQAIARAPALTPPPRRLGVLCMQSADSRSLLFPPSPFLTPTLGRRPREARRREGKARKTPKRSKKRPNRSAPWRGAIWRHALRSLGTGAIGGGGHARFHARIPNESLRPDSSLGAIAITLARACCCSDAGSCKCLRC